MGLDITKLRKLVAIDENDPLSRFALGQALFREGSDEAIVEAVGHLQFTNEKDTEHLATYHMLGQALLKLGRHDEAKQVLHAGCEKAKHVGDCMGKDLGPAMEEMLAAM